jgi:uncharacterized membrane protein HdeD (DUF308 family)
MDSQRGWYRRSLYIEGVAFLILGVIGLVTPVLMTFAIEVLIGSLFLLGGVFQGWRALTSPNLPGFWPSLLSAILYFIVGALLFFYPLKGVLTLTFLVALFLFIEGIFQIAFATVVRPLANWGWVLINGLLAIVLSFLIWSGWPGSALWVIGVLVGINLIFYGASRLFLAKSY